MEQARVRPAGDPGARSAAASALERGLVVTVPTDTVYGIAARLDRPTGIERLFALKGRRREVAIAVLVHDTAQAAAAGRLSGRARRLAARFWPGPLTIVVPRAPATQDVPIGGDGASIGLRVPDHADLLRLLAVTGPLATTSANRSGEATPATADGVAAVFGDGVAVYLDAGPASGGAPSTVVSDLGRDLVVIRPGPVAPAQLADAVGHAL